MRKLRFFVGLLACTLSIPLQGQNGQQTQGQTTSPPSSETVELQKELERITTALAATQRQLEQSQQQMEQLQQELARVSKQLSASGSEETTTQKTVDDDIKERVEMLESQVKLHDQTKVETGSKYPVVFSGLALFNGFVNRGAVDNVDLPSVALPGGASGSTGAGMRQTELSIEGFGPRIAGARSSAKIDVDFYGGIPYGNYGTVAGVVRMKTASIRLDWKRNSLDAGMEGPLISPLSPASYAMVAMPAMAWAGNLWTWAPQLRYTHQFLTQQQLQVELGLWDSPAAGYNSSNILRAPSAGELSGQPGYEARISWHPAHEQELQIGLSGYYSRQSYSFDNYTQGNDSWAFAADWRIPLMHRFELSGEGYRGRSLGGLGGGVYKDVIYGSNPLTGEIVIRGLNAIGGWTEVKARFGGLIETNVSIGMDNGFANDFHQVILSPTASTTELRARNRMMIANLIYRPKTYLLLSPEYRRIWTWPITGTRSTTDIYTLSLGYQF
ncbi:MAG: hypothetical protein FWD64_01370 [Acidobacteriaceae bacterium]|nr:hypothetical protein [Acidobacteriaceae bacterium]